MTDRGERLIQCQHREQEPGHRRRRRHVLHAAVAAGDVDPIIGCDVVLGQPGDILRRAQASCLLDRFPVLRCRRGVVNLRKRAAPIS